MKILIIGPKQKDGSLTPYIADMEDVLKNRGIDVSWIGSSDLPFNHLSGTFYSKVEIKQQAENLFGHLKYEKFDFVLLHFGKLELEQLALAYIEKNDKTKIIKFVHSLDWDLFTEFVPAPELYFNVCSNLKKVDGFIFFGNYARTLFNSKYTTTSPNIVLRYAADVVLANKNISFDDKVFSHVGCQSPWKRFDLVFDSFKHISRPCRFILAGPYWDNLFSRNSFQVNKVKVEISSRYIRGEEFRHLISKSLLGVFPYLNHPTFQGSAAISNYLANRRPAIVFNSANLSEYVGNGGIVLDDPTPHFIADAFEQILFSESHYLEKQKILEETEAEYQMDSHVDRLLEFLTILA